jgi:hypothetical protein
MSENTAPREWELRGFAYLEGGVMTGVKAGPELGLKETVMVREVLPPASRAAAPVASQETFFKSLSDFEGAAVEYGSVLSLSDRKPEREALTRARKGLIEALEALLAPSSQGPAAGPAVDEDTEFEKWRISVPYEASPSIAAWRGWMARARLASPQVPESQDPNKGHYCPPIGGVDGKRDKAECPMCAPQDGKGDGNG